MLNSVLFAQHRFHTCTMRKYCFIIVVILIGALTVTAQSPCSGASQNYSRLYLRASPSDCSTPLIPGAVLRQGYCAWIWKDGLRNPRGIDVAPNGDLLVVDKGTQTILALWENAAGASQTATLATTPELNLNHAVKWHDEYLYASSSTTVYRWPYSENEFRKPLQKRQDVITNMPPVGAHETRTLEFDAKGRLYINIGSASNIDQDSTRSRIVRFDMVDATLPLNYADKAFVFADGTRNEVGLRMDKFGRLWGVENGLDNLGVPNQNPQTRLDFGDIHVANPSEEVNLFLESNAGKFYGYPYCWTEGSQQPDATTPSFPQGAGPGTQWSTFTNKAPHNDAWCKNATLNVPPIYSMEGHCAPLDLLFYYGTAFPSLKDRVLFVPKHGSWNRPWNEATGRSVDMLILNDAGLPTRTENLFRGPDATWKYRPTSIALAPCLAYGECLFITDDNSGTIIAIGYGGGGNDSFPPPPVQPAPVAVQPPVRDGSPVQFEEPITLELDPWTRITYVLHANETISLELFYSMSAGWFAVGFNDDGHMQPTEAVLAFVYQNESRVGTIYVNSFMQDQIMSSFNTFHWQMTQVSFNPTQHNTTLKFSRPMFVPASERKSADIMIDGTATYVLVAWHSILQADPYNRTLPRHTGRMAVPIDFARGLIVHPEDPPSPTNSPQSTTPAPITSNQEPQPGESEPKPSSEATSLLAVAVPLAYCYLVLFFMT